MACVKGALYSRVTMWFKIDIAREDCRLIFPTKKPVRLNEELLSSS